MLVSRNIHTLSVNPCRNTLAVRNYIDLIPAAARWHRIPSISVVSTPADSFVKALFATSHCGRHRGFVVLLARILVSFSILLFALISTGLAAAWTVILIMCAACIFAGLAVRPVSLAAASGFLAAAVAGVSLPLALAGVVFCIFVFCIGSGRYGADYLIGRRMLKASRLRRCRGRMSYAAMRYI